MLYFLKEGFIFSFGVVLNKVIILARIQISISDEYLDMLDGFCDVAGATRSGVIEVLIRDYFDDLVEKVGEFSGELVEEAEEEEEGEEQKYPESKILKFRRRQEKEMYREEGEGDEEEDLEEIEEGDLEEGEEEED